MRRCAGASPDHEPTSRPPADGVGRRASVHRRQNKRVFGIKERRVLSIREDNRRWKHVHARHGGSVGKRHLTYDAIRDREKNTNDRKILQEGCTEPESWGGGQNLVRPLSHMGNTHLCSAICVPQQRSRPEVSSSL